MPTLSPGSAAQQLARLEQAHPEWHAWLRPVGEVLGAAADPGWEAVTVTAPAERPADAPRLAGTTITAQAPLLDGLLRRLLAAAAADELDATGVGAVARAADLDPLALLEAAANSDLDHLTAAAVTLGADRDALAAIANLAVAPVLHAARRQAAVLPAPAGWTSGACPTCGGWATLAEIRGLERARRLRCARCGDDWPLATLRCPFCGNADHANLGALVPEGDMESRKVDTCTLCRGYLKTMSTLRPLPPMEIMLADLATVELDLAALDKGYERPPAPGAPLALRLVATTATSNGLARDLT